MFGFNRTCLSAGLVVFASLLAGCGSSAPFDPNPGEGGSDGGIDPIVVPQAFCSAGALDEASYRDLGSPTTEGEARSVAVSGGYVLLGTDDGLFRRPIDGSRGWSKSGLEGLVVRALVTVGDENRVLLAAVGAPPRQHLEVPPIARSNDGGRTWQFVGDELYDASLSTAESHVFLEVGSFAFQPARLGQDATIYANVGGSEIAESTDLGASWKIVSGARDREDASCLVHIAPGAPDELLQACASEDDEASITAHQIERGGFDRDGDEILDASVLKNRRPLVMTSSAARPSFTYVGVEGGLLRVEGERWAWLWKGGRYDANKLPYADITAVWADPCDPMHVVMSGTVEAGGSILQVYETFDNGRSVQRVPSPRWLSGTQFEVAGGVMFGKEGESLALAVTAQLGGKPRPQVVVRTHGHVAAE